MYFYRGTCKHHGRRSSKELVWLGDKGWSGQTSAETHYGKSELAGLIGQGLAKPFVPIRRYNGFSEVLRSSEGSSQKFSECIQNGCLKKAKLSKKTLWGPLRAPYWGVFWLLWCCHFAYFWTYSNKCLCHLGCNISAEIQTQTRDLEHIYQDN